MKTKSTGLLKASTIAIALLGSAAIVGAFTFPDTVYAKEGKGNGGSNGNGNGGGKGNSGGKGNGVGNNSGGDGKGKGSGSVTSKGGGKKAAGKSGRKSVGTAGGASKRSKGKQFSLKDLFGGKKGNAANKTQKKGIKGLFNGKKQQAATARTKNTSVKQSPRPTSRKAIYIDDGTLDPRNLGKLNGAINSSTKAKLAHIANGQYAKGTGPVSLAAGLAVADANFNHAMGKDSKLSPEEVQELNAAFGFLDDAPMSVEEAEEVLANEEANPGSTDPDDLEDAQAVKDAHDLTTDEDGNPVKRPTEDQAAAAEAVHQAEAGLLGHYKGDFSDDDNVATEQQDRVLGAVRASNPDDEAVKAALGTLNDEYEYADGEDDGDYTDEEHADDEDEDEASDDPAGEDQTSEEELEDELARNG
ncbi:hypothetical protein [Ruegeria lacuscaerulensis]|uniref:hypothetical protein n=1 Tax=Ruegeria lacuscaerulensis TaxID=55218 RepID=UPI001479E75F|nr:hypothetical protein [Ruegeria lacuscaerulensis]